MRNERWPDGVCAVDWASAPQGISQVRGPVWRRPQPSFIRITDGKAHDVNILDKILIEAGAFYVMDCGYLDFKRLHAFTRELAFFATRTKENVLLQRRYSHPVDKSTGARSDQTVILATDGSAAAYPDALRRRVYFDAVTGKRLKFLTNNFTLPALTIAEIYKQRWQVEMFFKWIKQHLRIKVFFGISENSVQTQIWIAVRARKKALAATKGDP
jgi:IS4 transposase